jgi:hypothetical protein
MNIPQQRQPLTCSTGFLSPQVSVDDDPTVDVSSSAAASGPNVGWKFERLTTLPTASVLIVVNLIMIGLVFLIPGKAKP